jgi:ketosteroid isomerase-like protein
MEGDMIAHRTFRPGLPLKLLLVATLMLASVLGSVGLHAATASVPQPLPVLDTGGSGGAVGNQGATFRLFRTVFGGDADATAAIVADTALIRTPEGSFAGVAGLNAFVGRMRAPFVTATFVVNDMAVNGDTVMARWTLRGSVSATAGAPIVLEGISALQFSDGKIVAGLISYDRMALSQQIEAANYTNMENARGNALPVLGAQQAPDPDLPPVPNDQDPRTPF